MDTNSIVILCVAIALMAVGILVFVFASGAANANASLLRSAGSKAGYKAAERSTKTQARIAGAGSFLIGLFTLFFGALPRLLA